MVKKLHPQIFEATRLAVRLLRRKSRAWHALDRRSGRGRFAGSDKLDQAQGSPLPERMKESRIWIKGCNRKLALVDHAMVRPPGLTVDGPKVGIVYDPGDEPPALCELVLDESAALEAVAEFLARYLEPLGAREILLDGHRTALEAQAILQRLDARINPAKRETAPTGGWPRSAKEAFLGVEMIGSWDIAPAWNQPKAKPPGQVSATEVLKRGWLEGKAGTARCESRRKRGRKQSRNIF